MSVNEDQDRAILDELHYSFAQLCADSQIQAYGEETAKKRFQLYYKAFSQDRELQSKGLTPTVLAKAAVKCLSNWSINAKSVEVKPWDFKRFNAVDSFIFFNTPGTCSNKNLLRFRRNDTFWELD